MVSLARMICFLKMWYSDVVFFVYPVQGDGGALASQRHGDGADLTGRRHVLVWMKPNFFVSIHCFALFENDAMESSSYMRLSSFRSCFRFVRLCFSLWRCIVAQPKCFSINFTGTSRQRRLSSPQARHQPFPQRCAKTALADHISPSQPSCISFPPRRLTCGRPA